MDGKFHLSSGHINAKRLEETVDLHESYPKPTSVACSVYSVAESPDGLEVMIFPD